MSLSECPSVVQITRLTSAIHRVRRKSAQRLAAVWQGFDETERKPVPIARVRYSKQGATVDVFDDSRTSFVPMVDHDSQTEPRLAKRHGLERTRSRQRARQTQVDYRSISHTTSRTGRHSEFRRLLNQESNALPNRRVDLGTHRCGSVPERDFVGKLASSAMGASSSAPCTWRRSFVRP